MQFRVPLSGQVPDLRVVERMLLASDPSALLDIAPIGRVLRITTLLDGQGLLAALDRGGLPVDAARLECGPSGCCGGCGG